jgi:SAM-dependent methyltransferase
MLPKALLPLLAVPGTNEAPRLVVESWAGDQPFSGWLVDRNRQVVARLLNFRFRFIGFDQEAETSAAFHCLQPQQLPPEPEPVALALDSPRLEREGDWALVDGRLHSPGTAGSTLRFSTTAPRIGLRFQTWPNGGIVEVRRNGALLAELDLYGTTAGLPTGMTLENDSEAPCEVSILVTGQRHPQAGAAEVLLAVVTEHNGPESLPHPAPPLPPLLDEPAILPPFLDWVAALQPDGVALDIGGPPGRSEDPRLLQLDWQAFDAPHLLADPLRLPFRDASLDLVHANGVINRIADPAQFAREIHRVLKPGGWALVSSMPGGWWRHGGPHLLDLTPAALGMMFAAFSECHVQSGGGLVDRTLAMMDWTGNGAGRKPRLLQRLQADLERFEADASPAALASMALWSIAHVRK